MKRLVAITTLILICGFSVEAFCQVDLGKMEDEVRLRNSQNPHGVVIPDDAKIRYDTYSSTNDAVICIGAQDIFEGLKGTTSRSVGFWIYFYPNGQLKATGFFHAGSPIGHWTIYHPDHKTAMEGDYKQGIRKLGGKAKFYFDGEWKFYHKDGSLHRTMTFNDGVFVSEKLGNTKNQTYYFDNGKIKGEGPRYEIFPYGQVAGFEDIKIGFRPYAWKKESSDGSFYYDDDYYFPFNEFRRTGIWTYYHENGNKKSEGEYSHVTNKRDGFSTFYYENGEKVDEGYYEDNEPVGEIKSYNKSGSFAYINDYTANGVYRSNFYKDETLSSKGKLDDNWKQTGEWKQYHYNGKLRDVLIFKDGGITSIETCYDLDGALILSNGNGIYKTYGANGKVNHECPYNQGQRTGIGTWYYDNGQVKTKLEYKENPNTFGKNSVGFRWNAISSYDRDGNSRNAGTLHNGNGTTIGYDSNGNVTRTRTYHNGFIAE